MLKNKRLILFTTSIIIVGVVTTAVEMVHRSYQLSSETSWVASQNVKQSQHASLHAQANITPHKSGSTSHTSISTSKGCTKTTTTKSTPETNGATEQVTSTAVKCTGGGSSSSTNVSITSNSSQSSSSGSSSSGQGGSSTNINNEHTNVHILE